METFGLILGHLVGDYILQNDFLAKNKRLWGTPWPTGIINTREAATARSETRRGHLACTVHCLLYTLAVWAFSFTWMPWWGLLLCFGLHWPIDRFGFAAWWMKNVSGQAFFASKDHPMFPWSIVMVDNIFHLLTLYAILALK